VNCLHLLSQRKFNQTKVLIDFERLIGQSCQNLAFQKICFKGKSRFILTLPTASNGYVMRRVHITHISCI